MDLSDFDYTLPRELIAQEPAPCRDASRLLIVQRQENLLDETGFRQLPQWLRSGDVLVLNDTQVIPARLHGKKLPGGAAIEMLLLEKLDSQQLAAGPMDWLVIASRASRLREGTEVVFGDDLKCQVLKCLAEGKFRVRFDCHGDWHEALEKYGQVPLPPYIARENGEQQAMDRQRYQTVYARPDKTLNSAAAPTAGLHFTPELLNELDTQGVQRCNVTLRVGLDTFLPMRVERVEEHQMHREAFFISNESAALINQAKAEKRRIIAVGTTSVRVLESAAGENGQLSAGPGNSELFIYPGYRFQMVDGMITNFHLPRSTLLLLVSALMGNALRERAYQYAIEQRFRFYSYGDAMLIL